MANYNSIHKGANIDEAVRRVLAAMRQETFIHTDGVTAKASHSNMIWIPRYVTAGFVAQPDLNGIQMGGFWVDKYQASQPDSTMGSRGTTTPNTPGAIPGVSQVLKVPWTNISWVNAKVACKNRGLSQTSTASAAGAAANELTDTVRLPGYAVGTQIKITLLGAGANTTVNADSAAAQKVLNVTATANFVVGQSVTIGRGTARAEVKIIGTIEAGVSLTMTVNLEYAHTEVQADKVENLTTYIRRITGFSSAATTVYFEPVLPANVAIGDSYTIDEYHLVTAYEWASMAYLACMIFGDKRRAGIDLPKGNNNYGRDYQDADSPENYGMRDPVEPGTGSGIDRVLTGSGPNSWSLTGHPLGVWDLNGNVWEWIDLLMGGGDSIAGEAGTNYIINPGFPEAGLTLPSSSNLITTLEDTDVNGKKAALPKTVGSAVLEYGSDRYYQATGERAVLRGGAWSATSYAGVLALYASSAPSGTDSDIGFRAVR